jgi:hypothetical protein
MTPRKLHTFRSDEELLEAMQEFLRADRCGPVLAVGTASYTDRLGSRVREVAPRTTSGESAE